MKTNRSFYVVLAAGWIFIFPGCKTSSSPVPATTQSSIPTASQPSIHGKPTLAMKTYKSGRNVAEVITWRGESAVTIMIGKEMVFRQSFLVDGDHGSYVVDAAWSPNGSYFAFKTASAGGHMPYRSPVHILHIQGT